MLTDVSAMSAPVRGVHWINVRGQTQRPEDRGGAYNREEAQAVINWVRDHGDSRVTVGVVTPFAAQAALIRRLAERLDSDTRERVDLRIGTVHTYQGDERDIMLFSPTLSDGARPGTAGWVRANPRLVNVAASRAKAALVVMGDRDAVERLGLDDLVALRDEAKAEHPTLASEETIGLDIECDGRHHEDQRGRLRRQDLARDAVPGRLGWEVIRVPAWRCLREPDAVADEIIRHWSL